MSSPENAETPAELHSSTAVVQALRLLEKDDYAEAIAAVESVSMAQHPVGYGHDIDYAHALLRPQLPKQAREVFEGGYRTLVALHEHSLTDYAERTTAFLQTYPGVLQYVEHEGDERRMIVEMRVEPADLVHRAAWLSVMDDRDERVWLVPGQLQCDVARFEPQLRQYLDAVLDPDESQ